MKNLDLPELTALEIKPYVRQVNECAKCGHWRIRLPGFLVRWFELPHASFAVGYCHGNLDPQKTITTFTGEIQVSVPCAGLHEDHLHVRCMHCGWTWLQETKESADRRLRAQMIARTEISRGFRKGG